MEGDSIPYLLTEIAGEPVKEVRTVYQEANLAWWDNVEIPRLEQLMQKDREYFIQHKEWEKRQFNQ